MQQPRLQTLFDELSRGLVLYARQWCDAPDDAVQEAFIDLANCAPEPLSPRAWLYTTTRRKAQNIARAENRRRRHHQLASEQQSASTASSDSSSNWFLPSNSDLLPEDVMYGLGAMPDDERELLVARVWGELNFEQLAELMDCSISSAHRRYRTALQRLKTILNTGMETQMESPTEESKLQTPMHCSNSDVEISRPQTPAPRISDREKSSEIARSAKLSKRKAGEST